MSRHSQSSRWFMLICQVVLLCVLVSFVRSQALDSEEKHTSVNLPALSPDNLSERPEGPLTESWAVIDGKVTLPCDVTPPYPGDAPTLVIISKGETPIYSVDARDGGTFKSGVQWSAPRLIGARGRFVMLNGGGLEIQHVRKTDQSDYHCRVEFHESPTKNSRVRLHLIVSPSTPVVLDSAGTEMRGIIGPYTLGDTITLSCSVKGGYPKPRVTWWHERYLLDDISEVTGDDTTINRIILPNLTRQHLDRKLTCQAQNSNLTRPIVTSVSLNMSFPPASVEIMGNDTPLSEGVQYTFNCQSTGSRPPANLTWSKDDNTVNHSVRDVVLGGQTQSTLTFTPTRDDNGRALVCRGLNPQLPHKIKEDTKILDIRYPPHLNLSLGLNLNTRDIKEGDDVYFECHVKGNPDVTSVEWYHNGTEMKDNKSIGMILSFKNLVLQGVSRENSGIYSCGASNSQGTARSNSFSLNVHYAPVCSNQLQGVYGSGRKEIVNITCSVESYPLPKSFTWALNTSSTDLLDVPRSHTTNNKFSSVLTYRPITPLDYGSLLCWAENNVGKQKDPCLFQVVPAAVPEPVHNCSAWHNNSAPGQVVIRCWPGWNGGLEQLFSLEVRVGITGENVASLNDQEKPRFTVTGLKPGEEYILDVTAANSQGNAPSIIITHLTPIDIAEKRLSKTPGEMGGVGVPTFIGVLIGVLSVLFLCCIMAAITIKIRGASARRPESSTDLRDSQRDDEDTESRKADEDPDVILVTAGLQSETKTHLQINQTGQNIDKNYPLTVVKDITTGKLSHSPSSQYVGTPTEQPPHAAAAHSRYREQTERPIAGYNTTNRSNNLSHHKYFPPIISEDQYQYQFQNQINLPNHSQSSRTLPSKKKYQPHTTPSDFMDILDYKPSDRLHSNDYRNSESIEELNKIKEMRNSPSFHERREELNAGFVSGLRYNMSRTSGKSVPSKTFSESNDSDSNNANSPQRESVV